MNNYIIKLIDNQRPPYKSIYDQQIIEWKY